MSNINCTNSDCKFMSDGKCCLNTVPKARASKNKTEQNKADINSDCPYFMANDSI
ncbi:hypothetical protein [Monoglobus pectinilyticus]|nr:hypothetical protein [Monoglobus pectinilyticus]MBS6837658.1 hypothetical protein [Clostridiales bacterium]MEE0735344.1 hypothetical protein [Monoglobus pectinilyticus]